MPFILPPNALFAIETAHIKHYCIGCQEGTTYESCDYYDCAGYEFDDDPPVPCTCTLHVLVFIHVDNLDGFYGKYPSSPPGRSNYMVYCVDTGCDDGMIPIGSPSFGFDTGSEDVAGLEILTTVIKGSSLSDILGGIIVEITDPNQRIYTSPRIIYNTDIKGLERFAKAVMTSLNKFKTMGTATVIAAASAEKKTNPHSKRKGKKKM